MPKRFERGSEAVDCQHWTFHGFAGTDLLAMTGGWAKVVAATLSEVVRDFRLSLGDRCGCARSDNKQSKPQSNCDKSGTVVWLQKGCCKIRVRVNVSGLDRQILRLSHRAISEDDGTFCVLQ